MIEKRKGPTPCGGAYSVAYYLDKNRNPVDRKNAVFVIVCEYDESGNLLFETTGINAMKMTKFV